MEVFIELAKRASFSTAEVKKLASAIGWQGCYGFNRLIHYHTDVAKLFVIKNSQDVSYSGKQSKESGAIHSVNEYLGRGGSRRWGNDCG